MYDDLTLFYERNDTFAQSFTEGGLPLKPRTSTVVLSCVDARVDPSRYIGLELGDALVLRTAGARVNGSVMTEVAALWQLMKLASGREPSLSLMIVHHTQCGMARFADPAVAPVINEVFGSSRVVDMYGIADAEGAVADDVERARTATDTPTGMTISGHIYDVANGRLRQIVDPVVAG